jgi:hypothetical protein
MDHLFKVKISEEITVGTLAFGVQLLGRGSLLSVLNVQGRPTEVHARGRFLQLI